MKKENVNKIFQIWQEDNPSPKSDLEYINPYTMLVAVVLSAQSTDKGVNKATKNLFKKIDTPQKMLELGIDELKEYIKTIGLYNNKAKSIMSLSKDLVEKHNGIVPDNRKDLEKLAGVGRKTANVVLNVVFGQPTIAVDTHVFRVGNRTGLAKGEKPIDVEKKLEKIIPENYKLHGHHWLILHGRYVCKSRKPDCKNCKIVNLCEFDDKIN
jgi:endonuclease-3